MFSVEIKKMAVIFLIFILLGAALYGITLKSPFLLDDMPQVVENPDIKSFANVGIIFRKGFLPLGFLGQKDQWYRPFQMFTYMVDYKIWKMDVKGYHISSIFLHVLNACLIFIFIRLLVGGYLVPFLTGLFFLVHPINTEAVNYISSRGDPLIVCFLLSSFISYIYSDKVCRSWVYIFALIFFSLGLVSKETAVIFPGLLFVYHVLIVRKVRRIYFFKFAGFLVILAVYLVIRENLNIVRISEVEYNLDYLTRIINLIKGLGSYLYVLVWPVNLNIYRSLGTFKGAGDSLFLSGIAFLLGSLFIFFKGLKKAPVNSFFIAWFFAAFLPTSGLLLPTTSEMAERYMYLPAIAIFFLFAVAINTAFQVKKTKNMAIIFLVILICFWLVSGFSRNMEWTDKVKFFSTSISRNSDNVHKVDLAGEYSRMGETTKAIQMYQSVLENPISEQSTLNVLNNMGNIYCREGKFSDAESCFKKALEVNSGFSRAYMGLGSVYFSSGYPHKAIDEYKKVLNKGGAHPGVYLNIGMVYESLGDLKLAGEYYNEAISFDKSFEPAYGKLVFLYLRQQKFDEAEALCQRLLTVGPNNDWAYLTLGNIALTRKDLAKAELYYEKILKIDPVNIPALMNLGIAYANQGKIGDACDVYEKVLIITPGNKAARESLNRLTNK